VLYTGTASERRHDSGSSLLPSISESDLLRARPIDQQARYAAERALDQVLADSFPASDPPSWTPGVGRPERLDPALGVAGNDVTASEGHDVQPVQGHVPDLDVPREKERPFLRGLVSLLGAAGIALLVPFVILLVGLPVALVVRGLAEAIAWLVARIVG
jgi:hypothetical protein